jgi:hypothetical protein
MAETRDPDSEHSPYLRLPWPAVALGLFLLVAGVLGLGVYANQNLRASAPASTGPTSLVGTAVQLNDLTPGSQPKSSTPNVPVGAAIPATTAPPTALPPSGLTATIVPTVGPTPIDATESPTAVAELSTELRDEVDVAYQHYWQVRAEALFSLDSAKLADVMGDDHLLAVEELLSQLRSEGRAIRTSVTHSYVFVNGSTKDVTILDRYTDNSIYVDQESGIGLTQPAGTTVVEQYRLVKRDGWWKVISLVRPA